VTIVISKGKINLTFSGETSGKAICSLIPIVKFPFSSKEEMLIP
jgi:hypothetical protein